ncbi:MAG: type II toxin-antitoxin system VapC family toxin [Pirellulaceae bacterium]|nr:type II toxin-antitoxin system VapC family toxin [Pirellulaceae bacterium]
MKFLIDTNICSAYLKGDRNVWGKFLQYSGGSAISVITAGELWTWVQRGNAGARSKQTVIEFIDSMDIIDVDLQIALEYGRLRGTLLDAGTPMPDIDALLAATALHLDLTLVTHNTADFSSVPNLRLLDWMPP